MDFPANLSVHLSGAELVLCVTLCLCSAPSSLEMSVMKKVFMLSYVLKKVRVHTSEAWHEIS